MDNTNLYCHYGIIYWKDHITDEIRWFYFEDVLLYANNIIRKDYETKPLKYMFKVFCFFMVMFKYGKNQTQHEFIGVYTKCEILKRYISYSLYEEHNKEKIFIKDVFFKHIGLYSFIQTKNRLGYDLNK